MKKNLQFKFDKSKFVNEEIKEVHIIFQLVFLNIFSFVSSSSRYQTTPSSHMHFVILVESEIKIISKKRVFMGKILFK